MEIWLLTTCGHRLHRASTIRCAVLTVHKMYKVNVIQNELEMLANAQRDGRPAEYRWRPVFNAAKFD